MPSHWIAHLACAPTRTALTNCIRVLFTSRKKEKRRSLPGDGSQWRLCLWIVCYDELLTLHEISGNLRIVRVRRATNYYDAVSNPQRSHVPALHGLLLIQSLRSFVALALQSLRIGVIFEEVEANIGVSQDRQSNGHDSSGDPSRFQSRRSCRRCNPCANRHSNCRVEGRESWGPMRRHRRRPVRVEDQRAADHEYRQPRQQY